MRHSNHAMFVTWASVISGVLLFPPQMAIAASVLMEELVVEAQRKKEEAQDVPVALSAYSDVQLERLQVVETLDIVRLVPNMIGHNNTGIGSANAYSIRGLNNTESIATFDPPVGTYVDDTFIARQNGNNFLLFDPERIEVLRGPQGTLFGRNTTGGAVRVILKKPGEERTGFVEGGFGSYDRYELRGTIDVPISDRVLTKVSAYWVEDDGYVDNVTTGESINSDENYGVRAALRWLINDNVTWDIAADYIDQDHPNIVNVRMGDDRISRTGLSTGGTPLAGILTNEKQNYPLQNEVEAQSLTSTFSFDTEIGELQVITSWRDLEQKFAIDFLDGNAAGRAAAGQQPPPYGGFTIANDGDHEQLTQEVKLNWDWGDNLSMVSGIYYLDEENVTDFGDVFDFDLSVLPGSMFPTGTFIPLVLADRILTNNTEAWAVYTQGDYSFNDELVLTLGLRYTDEEKDIAYSDNQPCSPADPSMCFVDDNMDGVSDNDLTTANIQMFAATKQSTEVWTPRVALTWTPEDGRLFYASATRGFKSGGWNARATSPEGIQPFTEERVWSYEVGAKTEWLDNRLRANVTAFYMDVSDFQLPTGQATSTGGIQFITRNFADLETYGLELELVANPIDPWTVFASAGIQETEYKNLDPSIQQQQADCRDAIANMTSTANLCNAGIVTANGSIAEPVRTPEYTVTVGTDYVYPVGDAMELTPSIYWNIVGDHWVGSQNMPTDFNGGYSTYNASLALVHTDQNWRVALECRNCNDRAIVASTLAGQVYLQDPRTLMLRFRKDFTY